MKSKFLRAFSGSIIASVFVASTMLMSASASIDSWRYESSLEDESNPWNITDDHRKTNFDFTLTSDNVELSDTLVISRGEWVNKIGMNFDFYDAYTEKKINSYSAEEFASQLGKPTVEKDFNYGWIGMFVEGGGTYKNDQPYNTPRLFTSLKSTNPEVAAVNKKFDVEAVGEGETELVLSWFFTIDYCNLLSIREKNHSNDFFIDALSTLINNGVHKDIEYYSGRVANSYFHNYEKEALNYQSETMEPTLFLEELEGKDDAYRNVVALGLPHKYSTEDGMFSITYGKAIRGGLSAYAFGETNVLDYYPEEPELDEAFFIIEKRIKVSVVNLNDYYYLLNGEKIKFTDVKDIKENDIKTKELIFNEGKKFYFENFMNDSDLSSLSISPVVTYECGNETGVVSDGMKKKYVNITKDNPLVLSVVLGNKKTKYIVKSNGETPDLSTSPKLESNSVIIDFDKGEISSKIPNIIFPDGTSGLHHDDYKITFTVPEEYNKLLFVDSTNREIVAGEKYVGYIKTNESQIWDAIDNTPEHLREATLNNFMDFAYTSQASKGGSYYGCVSTGVVRPLSPTKLPTEGVVFVTISAETGNFNATALDEAQKLFNSYFGNSSSSSIADKLKNFMKNDATTITLPLTVKLKGSNVASFGKTGITPTKIVQRINGEQNSLLIKVPLKVLYDGKEIDNYIVNIKTKSGIPSSNSSVTVENGFVCVYNKITDVIIEIKYNNMVLGECSVKVSSLKSTENYIGGSSIVDYSDDKDDDNSDDNSKNSENENDNSDNNNSSTPNSNSKDETSSGKKEDFTYESIFGEDGKKDGYTSLTISNTKLNIKVGDTKKISVEKNDNSVFGAFDYISWTSSDNSIAMVIKDSSNQNIATIKAYKAGKTTIKATDTKGNVVSCVVTVEDDKKDDNEKDTSDNKNSKPSNSDETTSKNDTPSKDNSSIPSFDDDFINNDDFFNDNNSDLNDMKDELDSLWGELFG